MGKTGVPAAGGGNAGLLFWARNIRLLTVHLFLASLGERPGACPDSSNERPSSIRLFSEQQICGYEDCENYGDDAVHGEEGGVELGKIVGLDQ